MNWEIDMGTNAESIMFAMTAAKLKRDTVNDALISHLSDAASS